MMNTVITPMLSQLMTTKRLKGKSVGSRASCSNRRLSNSSLVTMKPCSLPQELFLKIISNLTYDMRLRCRLVCKTWRNLIDSGKLTSLVICGQFEGIVTQRWFDTNRPLTVRNVLPSKNFDLIFSLSSRQILINLKELAIYSLSLCRYATHFEALLNSFVNVARLDLYAIQNLMPTTVLELPNLLAICIDSVESKIVMRGAQLRAFKYCAPFPRYSPPIFGFEFAWPASIEYVELPQLRCEDQLCKISCANLNEFVQLKYLFIEEACWTQHTYKADCLNFEKFHNLKEIHFRYDTDVLDRAEQRLKHRRALFNRDYKIVFFGVELEHNERYPRRLIESSPHETLADEQLKFYIQHYAKLASRLPFIYTIRFNAIERHLPSVPIDFFDKLTNLSELVIDGELDDEGAFFAFVRQLRYGFPIMSLKACRLSQRFFNKLPIHCWYVQTLILDKDACKEAIDLEFVLNLKHLNILRIEQDVHWCNVDLIFENLKFLSYFSFYEHGALKSLSRHLGHSLGC